MSVIDPRSKKYYWLKLEKDFFKRHDIKVIESMENGKDYLIFYMKLLLESVSHHGLLRFNDTVPYNDKMLATITNTNIDIVRSAVNIFTQLDLMSVLDDKTIYLKEVEKRMGQETGYAVEKRRKRLLEKEEQGQIGTMSHNNSISISNSLSNSISNTKRFIKPNIQDIKDYIKEKNYNVDAEQFYNYYESVGWVVGKNKMKSWKAAVATWEKRNKKDEPKKKEYEFNLS